MRKIAFVEYIWQRSIHYKYQGMHFMELKRLKSAYNKNKRSFRSFITRLEKSRHAGINKLAENIEKEVWQEVQCLSCANCCKKMTPTLNAADKKRIANYLGISTEAFTEKYLEYDKKEKDWRMQKQPCMFLDLKTNKCGIYEIRPLDCRGFPHLTKKPMKTFMYIHKQNIEYCPATYRFVEKMMDRIEFVNH